MIELLQLSFNILKGINLNYEGVESFEEAYFPNALDQK